MTIAASHDCYRVDSDSQSLAVNVASGAVVSTVAFGSQVRLIQLVANGIPSSSTGGVRVKFGTIAEAQTAGSTVSSTLGALIPFNFPEVWKINPGEVVMALSNNTGAATLVVTPLTD